VTGAKREVVVDFTSMVTKKVGQNVTYVYGDSRLTSKLILCPWCGERGVYTSGAGFQVLHGCSTRYGPLTFIHDSRVCHDPVWRPTKQFFANLRDLARHMIAEDKAEALRVLRANLGPGEWSLAAAAKRLKNAGAFVAARNYVEDGNDPEPIL
jgi:hypothetical protein